jgi:hypothetical protein
VYKKELAYCSQCDEFPCDILKKWGAEHKHHAEALDRLIEIMEQGVVHWLEEHGY